MSRSNRTRYLVFAALALCVVLAAGLLSVMSRHPSPSPAGLTIVSPLDGTVFPPDIAAPAFRWRDDGGADAWRVAVGRGGRLCRSELLRERQWAPTESEWRDITRSGPETDVPVEVTGVRRERPERIVSAGGLTMRISADEVGAAVFYREVNLPFGDAIKDPTLIRWRLGSVSSARRPKVVLESLPVCGNCHSFSADGSVLGMDVDYANDKGSYAIAPLEKEIVLDEEKIITWSDYRREDGEMTYGLLSQISPDGRYVVSTVKDRSVFLAKPDLEYSQVFFPVKGILVVYDRDAKEFRSLAGADDPRYVQSNPAWSADGKQIVFARAEAPAFEGGENGALLSAEEERAFLAGERPFLFDLYRVPFNAGAGGRAEPVGGASRNGMSNFFPKLSPDGRWLVFCRAASYMLLQPDSELYIMPAGGGEARRMRCNTSRMNSWHSWSPNSRWLVFSSKAAGPYTRMYLTHIDERGRSSPPILLEHFTAPDRAANIPEFLAATPDALARISPRFLNDISFLRAGDAFLRAGDTDRALTAYRKALRVNPGNGGIHHKLGAVLCEMGEVAQGIEHLQKALELAPGSTDVHGDLGLVFERQGRLDEAVRHFERALDADPKNIKKILRAARCLAAQTKYAEAAPYLQKALEIEPGNAEVRHRLGVALRETGAVEQALEHLKKALTLSPGARDAAEIHTDMGVVFFARRQFDEALVHCRRALELQPRNVGAVMLTADCCEAQERYDEVLEHRREAVAIAPELSGPRLALARARLRRHEYVRALRHLEAAAAQSPADADAVTALAWLLSTCPNAEIRNAARAVKMIEPLCRGDGGQDPHALDVLAAAYAEAGRFTDAAAAAEKALRRAEAERKDLAPAIRKRLEQYRLKKSWRLDRK